MINSPTPSEYRQLILREILSNSSIDLLTPFCLNYIFSSIDLRAWCIHHDVEFHSYSIWDGARFKRFTSFKRLSDKDL